jgi:hypothetical protein
MTLVITGSQLNIFRAQQILPNGGREADGLRWGFGLVSCVPYRNAIFQIAYIITQRIRFSLNTL